jgi:hypothetical protein
MNWMFVLISVIACAVCAMLGLTAGVNLNPVATVKFVWDWNAAGSWVSGLGTLLAVLVTLWQIRRQQEREKPRLNAQQEFEEQSFTLALVSTGLVPATVLGAYLSYDEGRARMDLSRYLPQGTTLPQRLDRGEVMSLLAIKGSDFSAFGRSLIWPLVVALNSQEIKSAVEGEGINEDYFAQLKSISARGASLLVKTAFGVEEFKVSDDAFLALTKLGIDHEHIKAYSKVEVWKRDALRASRLFDEALERLDDEKEM